MDNQTIIESLYAKFSEDCNEDKINALSLIASDILDLSESGTQEESNYLKLINKIKELEKDTSNDVAIDTAGNIASEILLTHLRDDGYKWCSSRTINPEEDRIRRYIYMDLDDKKLSYGSHYPKGRINVIQIDRSLNITQLR